MIETDTACFDGTSVYADTDEAPTKAGDLLAAFQAGVLKREDLRGTLADLVSGKAPGAATRARSPYSRRSAARWRT